MIFAARPADALSLKTVFDAVSDARLARIARLLSSALGCPKAGIAVADGERLKAKVVVGDDTYNTPKQLAFCSHVLESGEPLMLPDALADARFRDHPAVAKRGVRFFAGQAIHAPDGRRAGVICGWDERPRPASAQQQTLLADLAALLEEELQRVDLNEAVQQLREIENHYRFAVELNPQIPWLADADGNIIEASSRWTQAVGMPLEQAVGTGWLAAVHPEDRASVMQSWSRAVATGASYDTEFRVLLLEGGYRWCRSRAQARKDSEGRVVLWYGSLEDIHDRKLAEQARQHEEERKTLALEAAGAAVFEMDLDRKAPRPSAHMNALFGFATDAAPSIDAVAQAVHPVDRKVFFDALRRLDEGQERLELEFRVVWPDDSVRYLRLLGKVLPATEGTPRLVVGTCWDVTKAKELQQQLSYQATHDALTGLLNRYEFERRVREAGRTAACDDTEHTICFIDLDRFKIINDTVGHAAGDALLRELGRTLAAHLQSADVLARLGGDEFGVLLPTCPPSCATGVAQKLLAAVENFSFQWQGRVYKIGASIGIARLTKATTSVDEVLSQADVACYAAKRAGRNRVSFYEPDQGEAGTHHTELQVAAGIREALEADRFCLYAQPIIATASTACPHYELLVRMQDPQGRLISPGAFIPAAEHYDLMHLIDRWVLEQALLHQGAALAAIPKLTISLNLSAHSLNDPSFLPFAERLLAASPLPPERIYFEITETAAVTHITSAVQTITHLRKHGCSIALDDFGAGLSSFSYLREFPVDIVKIDGSFIRKLKNSSIDRAIVESIHDIAHKIGAKTVAEFVEDDQLLSIVRELGIDYAQGYGIGKPQALEEVLRQLAPD